MNKKLEEFRKDEIRLEIDTTHTPIEVDMSTASWKWVIGYATGWLLLPILVIVSKLFRIKISWFKYQAKDK